MATIPIVSSDEAEEILFGLWLRYLQTKKHPSQQTVVVALARRLSAEYGTDFGWESLTWFDDRIKRYPTARIGQPRFDVVVPN